MLPTPTANTNTTTPKTQPSPIPIAYHAPEHISTLYCPLHSYSLHHHHYEPIMSTTATCCSAAPTSTTPNYHCSYLYLYGYAHVEHIPTLSIAFCTHPYFILLSCTYTLACSIHTHTCKTPETLLHTLVQTTAIGTLAPSIHTHL